MAMTNVDFVRRESSVLCRSKVLYAYCTRPHTTTATQYCSSGGLYDYPSCVHTVARSWFLPIDAVPANVPHNTQ